MLSCSDRGELQMAIKPICETPQTQWKHVGDLSTGRMMMLRAIANRLNIASPLLLSLPAAVLARRGRTQQTQQKVRILQLLYERSNVRCMGAYRRQEAVNKWS